MRRDTQLRNTKLEANMVKIWLKYPNMTYATISHIFHVSRQRVFQIISRYKKENPLLERGEPSPS